MMKLNYFFKKCQNGIESFLTGFFFILFIFFSVFVRSLANLPRCQKNGLAPTILLRLFFLFFIFFEELFAKFEKFSSKQIQFLFSFLLLHF